MYVMLVMQTHLMLSMVTKKCHFSLFRFLASFLIVTPFLISQTSCNENINNKSIDFVSNSLLYVRQQYISFHLTWKISRTPNSSDFVIDGLPSALQNNHLQINDLTKVNNVISGKIIVVDDSDLLYSSFIKCNLIYNNEIKAPFFLVKRPTIVISVDGTSPLDKDAALTLKTNITNGFGWPLTWSVDNAVDGDPIPNWCGFSQNYSDNSFYIQNDNEDENDYANINVKVKCTYATASAETDVQFTNTNGEKMVPESLFQFDSDKQVVSFNTGNASLASYDVLVVPNYSTTGIANAIAEQNGVFYNKLQSIKKLVINSNSECTNIGDYSFAQNTNLESVVFSQKINRIGTNAFAGCASLKDISFLSKTPPQTFGTTPFSNAGSDRQVHVLVGYKDIYNTTEFKQFLHVDAENIKDDIA